MSIQDSINERWLAAFKSRDQLTRSTMELLKHRFQLAEKSGRYQLPLTDADVIGLIQKEYKERQSILEFYSPEDEATKTTLAQLALLEEYMPKQKTEEEVIEIIKKLAEIESNPGKLIGLTVKEVGNTFDKSKIAGLIKQVCPQK
jgi:uncharacterized protein YqeY